MLPDVLAILLILLALPALLTLLYLLAAFAWSYPYHRHWIARYPFKPGPHGIETIPQAAAYLREQRLAGWELVTAAQQLVSAKMAYSRRNSWDTPSEAFRRGLGYCLQQAEALQQILALLGIEAQLVQSTRNHFPAQQIHEYLAPAGICGHAWLTVTLQGQTRHVCPGHPANTPGQVHFTIAAPVTPYRGPLKLLGHAGSALLNTIWDQQARRQHPGPP